MFESNKFFKTLSFFLITSSTMSAFCFSGIGVSRVGFERSRPNTNEKFATKRLSNTEYNKPTLKLIKELNLLSNSLCICSVSRVKDLIEMGADVNAALDVTLDMYYQSNRKTRAIVHSDTRKATILDLLLEKQRLINIYKNDLYFKENPTERKAFSHNIDQVVSALKKAKATTSSVLNDIDNFKSFVTTLFRLPILEDGDEIEV